MLKSLLLSRFWRNMGCSTWSLWTVGYWAIAWLTVLCHLSSTAETVCFIGSWPFYAVVLTPTLDVFFFLCVPIFIWLFLAYWTWLLRFVRRNALSLLAGCVMHILGGVGWVCMYNQSHYGIPFRFYFGDTIAGGCLTAGYILGYGAIRMFFEKKNGPFDVSFYGGRHFCDVG
ncbi:MAG: hypothetical protein EOM54_15260 [Clostridia bacterium]|jgi:hypothetical protein|nr:hypothetical protein [Clostridia bacterium]